MNTLNHICLYYLMALLLAEIVFIGNSLAGFLSEGNIYFILQFALIVSLFVSNFFVLIKRTNNDIINNKVLIANVIYAYVISFSFNFGGYVIQNVVGIQVAPSYVVNRAGSGFLLDLSLFDLVISFFKYDITKYPGYSIKINLVTMFVGIILLLDSIRKNRQPKL